MAYTPFCRWFFMEWEGHLTGISMATIRRWKLHEITTIKWKSIGLHKNVIMDIYIYTHMYMYMYMYMYILMVGNYNDV